VCFWGRVERKGQDRENVYKYGDFLFGFVCFDRTPFFNSVSSFSTHYTKKGNNWFYIAHWISQPIWFLQPKCILTIAFEGFSLKRKYWMISFLKKNILHDIYLGLTQDS